MKKVLIVLLALVVSFLAGYVPQYFELQEMEQQCTEAEERYQELLADEREQNRVLQLHSELGMLLLEAQQSNFGNARERSTKLFNAVRDAVPATSDPKLKGALTNIMQQRDEITSGLTAASPEAVARIRGLYHELAVALETP